MKKFLLGALAGFVLSLFAMLLIESNYLAPPIPLSGQSLIQEMEITIHDGSLADWWLKEKGDTNYLFEAKYPLRRTLFSVPLNEIDIKVYKGKTPIRIKKEDITLSPN